MKVQCYYSVTNAFQSVFWVKYIVRRVIEVHKSWMPCFFMSISTMLKYIHSMYCAMSSETHLGILFCFLKYLVGHYLVFTICHYGDNERIMQCDISSTDSPSPTQLNSSSNCLSFTSSCTTYILHTAQELFCRDYRPVNWSGPIKIQVTHDFHTRLFIVQAEKLKL